MIVCYEDNNKLNNKFYQKLLNISNIFTETGALHYSEISDT